MAAGPAPSQTITVGDISITYLPDGEGHFVAAGMFPASGSQAAWQNHARWLDDDGRVVVTLGSFLIRTGDRTVLVDLGLGEAEVEIPDFATAKSGSLLSNLSAAGLSPSDITTVLYTHLHSDHTGWTTGGGSDLTFPNADHLVGAEAEVRFWRENQDAAFAPPADSVLDPMASRLSFCSDGQTIAPGVTVRATPGHTPGHQSVVISSGSERAVLLGDVAHCPAQLEEPDWTVLFDVDADTAKATRDRLFDELEGTDTPVGACHFAEAAFGRIVRGQGKRYWQPVG